MGQNQKKETLAAERKRELNFQLWGWLLFVVCAILFIAASIKNQDALTLMGSLFFLIACVIFLIPLVRGVKLPAP
ncbi:MAG: hypothetical protein PVI06_16870 [Desulfobacterales bacterium]|jgi:uncharacterized Tic20 family protein